jgi:hypothetical protein
LVCPSSGMERSNSFFGVHPKRSALRATQEYRLIIFIIFHPFYFLRGLRFTSHSQRAGWS